MQLFLYHNPGYNALEVIPMATFDRIALALSDPIRLSVLDMLVAGRDAACCSPANPDEPEGICSCDLLPKLDLAPTKLSYHMKELREAGLVSEQKRGRWVYYTLNRDVLVEFQREIESRFVSRPVADPCCVPQLIQLMDD